MNIVLVDDHASFRESLRFALWQLASIRVGEASTGDEALALIERERPELAIVDLALHNEDGLQVVRRLARENPTLRILVLSAHANRLFVERAFASGAHGYALKAQRVSEIVEAMRTTAAGRRYLAPALRSAPVAQRDGQKKEAAGLDQLTRRQREIFNRVIDGHSSEEIAQELGIGLRTVESHRLHINRKLGAHSTADLMSIAAVEGLFFGGGRRG